MLVNLNNDEFYPLLNQVLDKFDKEDYRIFVNIQAKDVSIAERQEFLDLLSSIKIKTAKSNLPDPEIIDEIDWFIEEIEEGYYYEGYGWDHEIMDKRIFGDETWTGIFNEYLQNANDLFEYGEYSLAKDVYQRLLTILDLEDSMEYLPHSTHCEVSLDLDEKEFLAKYSRCIYITTENDKRAEALYNLFDKNWTTKSYFSLKRIQEIKTDELPDFDSFLSDFVKLIEPNDSKSINLLIETKYLLGGLKSVAELVENEGQNQAQMYIKLLSYIEREEFSDKEKFEKIVEVVNNGLKKISVNNKDRAEIAEILIKHTDPVNDKELRIKGYIEAFNSDPSITRFLDLYTFITNTDEPDMIYSKLIDRIREVITLTENKKGFKGNMSTASTKLLCQVLTLTDKIDQAFTLCKNDKIDGFHFSNRPVGFFLPFLLKLLSKQTSSVVNPLLTSRYGSTRQLDTFNELITNIELSKNQFASFLNWADVVVKERIRYILDNTERNYYNEAARLLLGLSHVYRSNNLSSDADQLISNFRKEYNRHRNFQKEMDKLT